MDSTVVRPTDSTSNGSTAQSVVYFAKAPRPGMAKTRLCPPLTPAEAAGLYRGFLQDLLQPMPGVDTYVYVWPAEGLSEVARLAAPGVTARPQQGADLWARLCACFAERFAAGATAVVVRNTDSPDLPPRAVEQALAACQPGRVVLGPDHGGGYYLIGLAAPQPALFACACEGAADVFTRTAARARELGMQVTTLEPAADVDRYEDLLALWARRLGSAPR